MSWRFGTRFLFAAATLMALVCFAFYWCLGPVVRPSLIRQLKIGMTQQQVAAVLGPPDEIKDFGWCYEKPFNPGWFVVGFDDDGRFAGYDHETAYP